MRNWQKVTSQIIGEEQQGTWTPKRIFSTTKEALAWVLEEQKAPITARRYRRVKITSEAWGQAADAMTERGESDLDLLVFFTVWTVNIFLWGGLWLDGTLAQLF